jgi:hypothetical protein
VIARGVQSSGGFFPIMQTDHFAYRLRPAGALDPDFANGRRLPAGTYVQMDNGRFLTSGAGGCVQRLTADAPRMAATMVEYHQPGLDRYFITAEGMESGILDADTSAGRWVRTGRTFGAWLPFELSGATRVCRFVADVPGGPSHFYTLDGTECAALRALDAATPPESPAWRFEGFAFSATAPVEGRCPTHLAPVYRAYNLGFEHGTLSNHRYTTDRRVYDDMVGRGWSAEGVRFCVPPVISNTGTGG